MFEDCPRLLFGTEELTWRHLPRDLVADGALAYLSAARTAGDGREYESGGRTLAAAFQSAGFRHVIAALGQLGDAVAERTAVSVYRALSDADGRLHPEHAARALHRALQEVRSSSRRESLAFASLVHLGP
ncbi:CHAT domain-containing protein [Streptomyces sp. cf386]|uniref:CHAT domain-containing protein n=1 Tax=Streptomyces sp. cf386 TaxID=1761904 RepID=UPI0015A0C2BA